MVVARRWDCIAVRGMLEEMPSLVDHRLEVSVH